MLLDLDFQQIDATAIKGGGAFVGCSYLLSTCS